MADPLNRYTIEKSKIIRTLNSQLFSITNIELENKKYLDFLC